MCEEITRFILNNRLLTKNLKDSRHLINSLQKKYFCKTRLLESRSSSTDIGANIYADELRRSHCRDIFFANIQRVKESIRVLEEFSKLINKKSALEFKKLRYQVYEIEKKSIKEISALHSCK